MNPETLKRIPLFADLSEDEQRAILARMHPEQFRKGEPLFRKGDPSEMLYLVQKGSVRLLGDGGVPLATLGPGSLLGEADALAGRPRSTGAQALSDLEVWTLSVADVRDLVARSPQLGLRLSEALGVRLAPLVDYLVERRLRPLRTFASLSEEELRALAERLTPVRLGEGVCFCNASSPKTCLCLVEEGAIHLVTETAEGREDFVELAPGASFGEMALLTGQPMTQTARAAEASTLWVLERKDFEDLVQKFPNLRRALSQELRAPLSTEDRSRAVEMLRAVPLFRELPQEALRAIARRLLVRHVPAGETVFAEGSAGDALYLVESGEVQIVEGTGAGAKVLATLRAGESFGEMALLTGKSRSAGARAVRDTNLWMLYRTDFEELLVRHPSISLALNRALSERLLEADRRFHEAHLGRIPLFRGLSTSQLEDLNRKLKPEVFRRGEVVCREGEEADRMWFIEAGQAEVVIQVEGEEVRLATLREGDFFGEMALLTGSVRSATVRAVTDLDLWALRKEDFDGLLLQYPTVAISLSQALSERLHATTERLTQIALSRPEARRVPVSLPERRVSPVVPAARPARRPTPAFGLQRSVLGALQRLQQMAQDAIVWFGERSAATKLRLAAVLLLLAWLCGISVPAMLVSSLSARTVQAQNAMRLALTQMPPVVAPAPTNVPATAAAPVALAAPVAQAQPEVQASAPVVEEPVVVIGGGQPEAAEEEVAPAPTPTQKATTFSVVTSETLNVRSGPDVVYDRIGRAAQGERFAILASSGTGWYLIDFGGREGWVSEDYVEVRGAVERIALAEVIPPTPTPVPPTPTPQPQPTEPPLMAAAAPALPPRKWDSRLDLLGVRVEPAAVAPGQPYWRLVEARWANEQESQGKHHIYVNVLDENGQRITGQPVVVRWHDGQVVIKTEDKPEPEFSCNFQMYTVLGAYDLYVDGLPSDKVLGMGLGTPELPNWTIHTSFYLVFQRTTG